MSVDLAYSWLIECAGFFLGGWIAVLLAAYVKVFGSDRA